MSIENKKLDDDRLRKISGGQNQKGYVFRCNSCGEVWTEWYEDSQNFSKEDFHTCPNCKGKTGLFKSNACALPWIRFCKEWKKLK